MASGWNRPNAANQPVVKQGGTKSPSVMKGVIVGAVAVVVGVVCIFAFSGKSEKPVKDTGTKPAKIKEVTPAAAPATEKAAAKSRLSNDEIRTLPKERTNELNRAELAYWKIYHPYPPPGKWQPEAKHGKYKIFSERADNEIAFLLAVEPGTPMFAPAAHFADGFEKKFLKSLTNPAIVRESDDEYAKSLKRAVNEAKAELKARYDAGEDIEKIMKESYSELQRLGAYRIAIAKEVNKQKAAVRREGGSEADLADVVTAANKMLEAKGIAPLRDDTLTRRAIEFQNEKEVQDEQ